MYCWGDLRYFLRRGCLVPGSRTYSVAPVVLAAACSPHGAEFPNTYVSSVWGGLSIFRVLRGCGRDYDILDLKLDLRRPKEAPPGNPGHAPIASRTANESRARRGTSSIAASNWACQRRDTEHRARRRSLSCPVAAPERQVLQPEFPDALGHAAWAGLAARLTTCTNIHGLLTISRAPGMLPGCPLLQPQRKSPNVRKRILMSSTRLQPRKPGNIDMAVQIQK